jgi:hypothetical protein
VKLNVLANWLPASIMNKIVVIPPPEDTAGADVWKMVRNCRFSISKIYHTLCHFDEINVDSIWKKIWKVKAYMFVWLMKHERILTNYHKSS